jgi:uncharacterized protein YjfI (DUF2170 family)
MAVQVARHRARNLTAESDFTSEGSGICARGTVTDACGGGEVLLTTRHIVPLSSVGSYRDFD